MQISNMRLCKLITIKYMNLLKKDRIWSKMRQSFRSFGNLRKKMIPSQQNMIPNINNIQYLKMLKILLGLSLEIAYLLGINILSQHMKNQKLKLQQKQGNNTIIKDRYQNKMLTIDLIVNKKILTINQYKTLVNMGLMDWQVLKIFPT